MTTPVQIDLEGVPLKRSLQLILKQIGLAYVVDDGILAITSENSIDSSIGPCYPELSPLNLKRARAENGDMTLEELREFAEEVKLRAQIDRQIYESSAPPKPAATVKAEEVEHLIRELKELVTLLKADHARAAKTSSK